MAQAIPETHAIHGSDLVAALHFSQQAPMIIGRKFDSVSFQEKPEEYAVIEQLFFSCLQTGDDRSALSCLDRLTQRFGAANERVMGLRGLYEEAIAEDQSALESCLHKYDSLLSENPVNVPILKRRVALLRSLSRSSDAISSLIELLKAAPTDAEAWCELSDLYQSQGMSSQAIFCLEEALLIVPNAWNIHARLGELQYLCACSSDSEDSHQLLRKSIRFFCRSVELCDDYLRGFYGLALATSLLLGRIHSKGYLQDLTSTQGDDIVSMDSLEKLNAFAKRKIEDIVKVRSGEDQRLASCQGELTAAKELLLRLNESS